MGFRARLAWFLVATLALVQVVTAVLVYGVTRGALIAEGGRQLTVAAQTFARQLEALSGRVTDNVQVLVQDFALRAALAQHDQPTILSALRNHGRRVGAARMLLIDLDGTVRADTAEPARAGEPFAYASLVQQALERPAGALVAAGDKVYWMVVTPVFAPNLIGLIGAQIPIDDRMLARLQDQSALPRELELVSGAPSAWSVAAHGRGDIALALKLAPAGASARPELLDADGREFVALAQPLDVAAESPAVTAVLGYSLDDALKPYRPVGMAWAFLLALGLAAALVGAVLIARGVSRPIEALATTARRIAGGDYRAPEPIAGGGEIGQLAAAFGNMAQAIREREERIRHQADHDAVTGLLNRAAAEAAIQRALIAEPTRPGALLMFGLTRLPEITKTMGHAIADRVMQNAATRLSAAAEVGLLARATDTEFAVWLPGVEKTEAISAALRMQQVLADPYQEAELAIDGAPAGGIALYPAHGPQASTLLQRAEVALFAAIGSQDAAIVYDPATDPHRPERLSLMADLREALERNQLGMHFQPKLHVATGAIDGAEGLVRWQHPKRGIVAPDEFIGLAEETGNIRRLTRWALARGVAQAQRWSERGWNVRVAINVSARDLDDAELPRRVSDLLTAHGVSARQIVIEITESAVMHKADAALQTLKRLADLGVDLAIDDFGVGQSSFAYLHRLPVRELKIDKAFVRNLSRNIEEQAIVRAMVELGHQLGYRVTAEGVEDEVALDYLRRVGCDYAQGYYIAKALAPEDFETFMMSRSSKAQA